jgi:hypothetical protein
MLHIDVCSIGKTTHNTFDFTGFDQYSDNDSSGHQLMDLFESTTSGESIQAAWHSYF